MLWLFQISRHPHADYWSDRVNRDGKIDGGVETQVDGDCRDINFDPLILPSGIEASNDPLLAARSAAYASSYLRRAGEVSPLHNAPQESKP